MRIVELEIRNFRAIRQIELSTAADIVIVAGPNGCGKSCVFDAIRLLKSLYGGYTQAYEWHQFFGELGIDANRPDLFSSLLRSSDKELVLRAEFRLDQTEKDYLRLEIDSLAERLAWDILVPDEQGFARRRPYLLAKNQEAERQQIAEKKTEVREELERLLKQTNLLAQFRIDPDGTLDLRDNFVLLILFSLYVPHKLGIIDYHGAYRQYNREQVSGIDLRLDATHDRIRQHSLYNYSAKYTNIKAEMAAGYIRELIARERGERLQEQASLIDTLKELFQHFFPGKEFLGPRPTADNSLAFPVRLSDGSEHDINDLSSGEKEVLYGYLRIRSTSPRNSVLLLDEPELHLNPRLIRGLPRFYHKHLGKALNNQIWLVTHSDALIRDAVGLPGMSVYHMASALDATPGENQARNLRARSEVESLIIEMVGDLATYRPFSTILLFEGEASEFDKHLAETLFPELMANFTAVSAGSKARVRQLKDLLDVLIRGSGVPIEIFSVTDRDAEEKLELGNHEFSWDVYHIENYLIDTRYVAGVLNDLNDSSRRASEEDVERWLTEAAALTASGLVYDQLQNVVGNELIRSIGVKPNRTANVLAAEFVSAVQEVQTRVANVIGSSLTEPALTKKEKELREQYETALRDGTWRKSFRGRDVLRRFVHEHCRTVGYEYFRNLIVSRMRDAEHKPPGMEAVLRAILTRASTPPPPTSSDVSRAAVLLTSSEAELGGAPRKDN